MYVDFDYECMEPFDDIVDGKECCFSLEPACHLQLNDKRNPYFFNNALMACAPSNPFMLAIIEEVFSGKECEYPASNKFAHVMNTTGPHKLVNIYENYANKDDIYLIPADLVSPFGISDLRLIFSGFKSDLFDAKLQNAKAIHYFLGSWIYKKGNNYTFGILA